MNEVIVTRAPRLNLIKEASTSNGSYFFNPCNGEVCTNDEGVCVVIHEFQNFQNHSFEEDMVHVFESFEAMCKWVANGRKLEDLQDGGRNEWIHPLDMESCQYAEVVEDAGTPGWKGHVLLRINDVWTKIDSPDYLWSRGEFLKPDDSYGDIMVWPLKPGDSITITPKP